MPAMAAESPAPKLSDIMLPLSTLSSQIAPDSTWRTVPRTPTAPPSGPVTPSATDAALPPGEATTADVPPAGGMTNEAEDTGAPRAGVARASHGRKIKATPYSTAGMPELWPNKAVTARNIFGGEWHSQNPAGTKDQFDVRWKGLTTGQQDVYKARARDLKKPPAASTTPPSTSAVALPTSAAQDGGLNVPAAPQG
ncbi:hypothetical protein A0H81_05361 [Grifola frondosa]|uniref:Uncharacterized protein n=1 Tax=Grifola frondosa TaxID=5627 RepID=A0A1C7MDM1_GRIFR|nr:hypothetical protein A0H81_05361 [Grifola frondosa]